MVSLVPLRKPGRQLLSRLLGMALSLLLLSLGLWWTAGRPKVPVDASTAAAGSLKVMTYSSFMNAWGPGPEIAKRYREKTGVQIEFQDAGDAGLILEKLKLFPVDVVIGLDQFSLDLARKKAEWRSIERKTDERGFPWNEPEFVAYDWAPITFVYRKGEIEPPKNLRDLLDPRFAGTIALEDPRTSGPGLQFLMWVLGEMGEEKGFEFLAQLKPNIHSVSPSWSTAYGAFKDKRAKLVLSYMTSPIYHLIEEKSDIYAAAVLEDGHQPQIEFAGVPVSCRNCTEADKFVRFVLEPETQKQIMTKNYMLPVESATTAGTPFADLPPFSTRQRLSKDLLARRPELFEAWRKLGL